MRKCADKESTGSKNTLFLLFSSVFPHIALLQSHQNKRFKEGPLRSYTNLIISIRCLSVVIYYIHITQSLPPSSIHEPEIQCRCLTSRVEHEYLHTLCTCVSFSWAQTISSSTVKTLKCCVMLSSAVYLTSCTS